MVSLDGEVDTVRDECGSITEEMDVFVDLFDDLEREFADESTVRDEEDRNFFIAATDGTKDAKCGALIELVLTFEVPVEEDCRVRRI